MSKTSATCEQG